MLFLRNLFAGSSCVCGRLPVSLDELSAAEFPLETKHVSRQPRHTAHYHQAVDETHCSGTLHILYAAAAAAGFVFCNVVLIYFYCLLYSVSKLVSE